MPSNGASAEFFGRQNIFQFKENWSLWGLVSLSESLLYLCAYFCQVPPPILQLIEVSRGTTISGGGMDSHVHTLKWEIDNSLIWREWIWYIPVYILYVQSSFYFYPPKKIMSIFVHHLYLSKLSRIILHSRAQIFNEVRIMIAFFDYCLPILRFPESCSNKRFQELSSFWAKFFSRRFAPPSSFWHFIDGNGFVPMLKLKRRKMGVWYPPPPPPLPRFPAQNNLCSQLSSWQKGKHWFHYPEGLF